MAIMKELRAETTTAHKRLESYPYFKALAEDLEFFKPRIEPDYRPAIEAALAMTEKIRLIALFPMEGEKESFHVTRINPEAGNHPIPEDEREITAALAASNRVWAMFPYYQARYGERGKRFSDSDTCWLATLTNLDLESIQQQMEWLARLLATRGMPSIMLEKTIQFLHEELVREVPENKSGRFSEEWIAAVDQVIEKAKARTVS